MASFDIDRLLESAKTGITRFLEEGLQEGRIDEGSYAQARGNTFPLLDEWLRDEHYPRISPNLGEGIARAIQSAHWEAIVNAFRQKARFGTGGIRGMMAFDRPSIDLLASEGIAAPVLKGPNTINDIVLLSCSTGVAQFGRAQNPPFEKVVIGYDSRIRGFDFARIVAELFLAYDYTVYFFDEPCPYPEMTFAIPYRGIKAELGILISASHNDYRYNGYKLSCGNGSQFDPEQRERDVQQVHRPGHQPRHPAVPLRRGGNGEAGLPGRGIADCGLRLSRPAGEDREHSPGARRPRAVVPDDGRPGRPGARVG